VRPHVQGIVPIIQKQIGLPVGESPVITGLAKWTEMADRCVCVCVCVCVISLSLSLSLYIYIYTCLCLIVGLKLRLWDSLRLVIVYINIAVALLSSDFPAAVCSLSSRCCCIMLWLNSDRTNGNVCKHLPDCQPCPADMNTCASRCGSRWLESTPA